MPNGCDGILVENCALRRGRGLGVIHLETWKDTVFTELERAIEDFHYYLGWRLFDHASAESWRAEPAPGFGRSSAGTSTECEPRSSRNGALAHDLLRFRDGLPENSHDFAKLFGARHQWRSQLNDGLGLVFSSADQPELEGPG